jgi:transposase-like protein
MDPSSLACPHVACPDKGVAGAGNICVHARTAQRYRCRTCRRTCAATTNTPLYRLHHPEATLTLVLTLLLHGCPIPAIVAAFGLDERTVRA